MEADDVQVSGGRGAGNVIADAAKRLEAEGTVRLTAINFAIPRLVQAVEIIKHKVMGLHQLNEIQHLEETNKTRLNVTLSFTKLGASHHGYQAPLPADQVENLPLSEVAKITLGDGRPDRFERTERPPRSERGTRTDKPVWKERREGAEHREEGARGERRGRRFRGRRAGPRDTAGEDPSDTHREPREPREHRRPHRSTEGWSEDRYERVPRRQEEEKIEENEIRITARRPAKYIVKDAVLLFKLKNHRSVILKASGSAIPRAVQVAESLRHSVAGLHQLSEISRREVTDLLRAKEEGLEDIEKTRNVPALEIILSLGVLDTAHYGYQAPLPASKVTEMSLEEAQSV